MATLSTRLRVPSQARKGEIITLRCMILHAMDNGYRFETQGTYIPMHIIDTFICRYNGEEIFRAFQGTGIAANPYLTFNVRATESGVFDFIWRDDRGGVHTAKANITVTA